MRFDRPVTAADPASFGRRGAFVPRSDRALISSDDLRLFLTTFAAGFAFTAVLIA